MAGQELVDLAKKHFDDLNDAEIELLQSVQEGKECSFSFPAKQDEEDLAVWRKTLHEFFTKNELPIVRGALLAWVMSDKMARERVTHRGIVLSGVRIEGVVDIAYVAFPYRLKLEACHITNGLHAQQASLGHLSLCYSWVQKHILCGRMRVAGNVRFRKGFKLEGELDLKGAVIEGQISCSGGSFINPGFRAIVADRMKVGVSVFLNKGFVAHGCVRLLGVDIVGQLSCRNGVFISPGDIALNANSIRVGNSIFLGDGFCVEGEVRLLGSVVGRMVRCRSGRIANEGGIAINGAGCVVGENFLIVDDFEIFGEVCLRGSKIGGDIKCSGSVLHNESGNALCLDGSVVSGDVVVADDFEVFGAMSLCGALVKNHFFVELHARKKFFRLVLCRASVRIFKDSCQGTRLFTRLADTSCYDLRLLGDASRHGR